MMRQRFTLWVIFLLVLDQAAKWLIVRSFELGQSVTLVPNILHFTYVQNRGAAFGMLQGQQTLFVLLSCVVIGWIVLSYFKEPPQERAVFWGGLLVAAGALGNLVDRLRLGYVIDFIDFRVWPVFNVADSAITIGVGLLLLSSMRSSKTPEPSQS